MKKLKIQILAPLVLLILASCGDVLDLQPKDKITADVMFASEKSTELYLANLYSQLPVEDFRSFETGFNVNSNGNYAMAMSTDEAIHSEWGMGVQDGHYLWWDPAYKLNRDINIMVDNIPLMNVSDEVKEAYMAEVAFLRAFLYFGLAKRYGGVPIILEKQEFTSDIESLKVPRLTEKETWDFILTQCDIAINKLSANNVRRASKYSALALKSRAALHAASIAKFGFRTELTGEAVTQKLVGIDVSEADRYYKASIDASQSLMNSGFFGLYKPSPASPEEAAENYRLMFQNPKIASVEAIFIRGYALAGEGHNIDNWYQPYQTRNGFSHPSRMNPVLELVDQYERYDSPGHSSPIVTTVDGDIDDYSGYSSTKEYLRYDTPYGIFEGKDARLWGTVILPGTQWKNTRIVIQAGIVKPDGQAIIGTAGSIVVNGTTYYNLGGASLAEYSGFGGPNHTRSGFLFKKFLDQTIPNNPGSNQYTTDWIEFRYAEILLNYAEAVIESGLGDAVKAADALNDVRRRAGHTADIPLTVDNVMRERTVEQAFENKRFWDLIRRREYHILFENTMVHALMPLLDLRALPEIKYIFVRANAPNQPNRTFQRKSYYRSIPGIGANGLVQNPSY